jgi:hypothetical protein
VEDNPGQQGFPLAASTVVDGLPTMAPVATAVGAMLAVLAVVPSGVTALLC